jgi:hypothetical protein
VQTLVSFVVKLNSFNTKDHEVKLKVTQRKTR